MLNISKDEKRYSEIELDLHKKLAYEKGRASIIEEFEKTKGDILNLGFTGWADKPKLDREEVLMILDNRISELKGESNEQKTET